MVKMSAVWDRTAEFLTDNITTILPIALAAFFVPLSIQGNFEPVMENAGPGLVTALGVLLLLFAALVTWGCLTLVAMALGGDGQPGRVALRRLFAALVMATLLGAAISLLAAPVAALILTTGHGAGDITIDLPAGVAVALGLYCILALGLFVWISARTMLLYPVIVAEKRMFGAPLRSWRMTRGIALQIVGVSLLYSIVTVVAVLATKTVFGSVFRLVAGVGEGGLSLAGVLTSVMVAAVQTGLIVIVPVFTAKLYQALASAERA